MKTAGTHQELLDFITALKEIQQNEDDTSKLDDLFVLERWLTSCSSKFSLPYPITLNLTEKPDFLISGRSMTIGIEVTKFLAEQRKRAETLASKRHLGHFPTQFDFDSPKRKNTRIESMIRKNPPGLSGWRNLDSKMNLYAEKLVSILNSKAQKTIRNGQHECDLFILVIEDCHWVSNPERVELKRKLDPKMDQHFSEHNSFDEVWFTSKDNSDEPLYWKKTI